MQTLTALFESCWSSFQSFCSRCSHLIIEHGTKRRSLQSPSHFTKSKKKQTSVLGSPGGIVAGLPLGGPALDKDGETICKMVFSVVCVRKYVMYVSILAVLSAVF